METKSLATELVSRPDPKSNPEALLRPRASSDLSTKRLFAECALVEIIHLHDCLRGALHKIQQDVDCLVHTASVIQDDDDDDHDRPAPGKQLEKKHPSSSSSLSSSSLDNNTFDMQKASELSTSVASRFHLIWSVFQAHSGAEDEFIWPALKMKMESKKRTAAGKKCGCESILEQEAYEEDHAHEETLFKQINATLRRLNGSFRYYHANPQPAAVSIIKKVILVLKEQTDGLTQHLEVHLEKEETQCLPMVKKHLTNEEISTLVGQIMGKRSAEMMGKILNLAVCSLPGDEREDMVKCLKKAMGGTFFEKWLTMGGWDSSSVVEEVEHGDSSGGGGGTGTGSSLSDTKTSANCKEAGSDENASVVRKRKNSSVGDGTSENTKKQGRFQGRSINFKIRHPSRYYIKNNGKIECVYNSLEAKKDSSEASDDVPGFTQMELIPTYHYSESKGSMVLGCEHYSRSCKLRCPTTGQLVTCRLCCEEERSQHKYTYETLPVLDRHSVEEILCMKCGSVQPAGSKCVNADCDSDGAPFAKYICSICNLYDDDENKKIYHCPYCNVCRKGEGLGIDFRHCMRCNACIDMAEYDTHVCISQRLQGSCPICKESMFESTEPLRGMKCGHVMHLSCYNEYASRCLFGRITCPLCKQVFDTLRG